MYKPKTQVIIHIYVIRLLSKLVKITKNDPFVDQ
jgi:hypothetical protein